MRPHPRAPAPAARPWITGRAICITGMRAKQGTPLTRKCRAPFAYLRGWEAVGTRDPPRKQGDSLRAPTTLVFAPRSVLVWFERSPKSRHVLPGPAGDLAQPRAVNSHEAPELHATHPSAPTPGAPPRTASNALTHPNHILTTLNNPASREVPQRGGRPPWSDMNCDQGRCT